MFFKYSVMPELLAVGRAVDSVAGWALAQPKP